MLRCRDVKFGWTRTRAGVVKNGTVTTLLEGGVKRELVNTILEAGCLNEEPLLQTLDFWGKNPVRGAGARSVMHSDLRWFGTKCHRSLWNAWSRRGGRVFYILRINKISSISIYCTSII